jgi:hypothetical protein
MVLSLFSLFLSPAFSPSQFSLTHSVFSDLALERRGGGLWRETKLGLLSNISTLSPSRPPLSSVYVV